MEEKCGSAAICFVAFLPDILDSKAEGRNKYLEQLLSVAEKFKRNPYRQVYQFSLLINLFHFSFSSSFTLLVCACTSTCVSMITYSRIFELDIIVIFLKLYS